MKLGLLMDIFIELVLSLYMTECRRLSLQNVGVLIQFLFLLIVLFIVTHKFVFSGQLFYPIYKSLTLSKSVCWEEVLPD